MLGAIPDCCWLFFVVVDNLLNVVGYCWLLTTKATPPPFCSFLDGDQSFTGATLDKLDRLQRQIIAWADMVHQLLLLPGPWCPILSSSRSARTPAPVRLSAANCASCEATATASRYRQSIAIHVATSTAHIRETIRGSPCIG